VKFVSIFTFDPSTMTGKPDEAAMGRLITEMMRAGTLVDTGGVLPTGISLRVKRTGSATSVTDGPFTETKEMIGGFAVLNVGSKDEAVEVSHRFLEYTGAGTCELHEVSETPKP
jgi:hypothetical protein